MAATGPRKRLYQELTVLFSPIMDTKRIRSESIRTAARLGVTVPPSLPLLEADLKMRSIGEATSRLLAMHCAAAVAYGLDRTKAVAWLDQESLTNSLSKEERRFVFEGIGQADRFRVQIEGMWALAWAMGIHPVLDFDKDCDGNFVKVLPNLRQGQSASSFRKRDHALPLERVVGACDLAYCLHWAIRQAELTGQQFFKLRSYVVIERRRALDWLLSSDAWDEVPLDT